MNTPNDRHDSLSPAEREQLAQELLELHFGCHEHPERLLARIAAEPAVRALQQDVLAQARVLEAAVQPATPALVLPTPRARASRWRWLRSPLGRLGSVAAVAAAAVLACFAVEQFATYDLARFQSEHLHLTVSAPRAVPAGAPWTFTVETRDLGGNAVDGQVRWEAFAQNGAMLASSQTATQSGRAVVAMPTDKDLQVPARVVVTANTATDSVQQLFSLSTAAAGPLVHVRTDRPVYRPGEPVFVRAVVLDRVTRTPLSQPQQLVARLLDGKGNLVANDYAPETPGGVGSFVLQVPTESAGGPHTLEVLSRDGRFPPERIDLVVRSFQAPQLEKQIVLDRSSYAPGARGSATVTAQRLAMGGAGALGAAVSATLVVDGDEVWRERRVLGPDGAATFAFTVPKDVAKGAARFVATIDDGGIVETEVKPFVVPTGKVVLAAYPEGGELIAGVDNRVYLECQDPLGRPIDGAGELLDDDDRVVTKFRTVHQGRGTVEFVPKAGANYRVRLVGHEDRFALPAVQEQGIALQLRGCDIAADAPLRLRLAGRGEGPWLLGVFCRGVLVGQTTLRAEADGTLRTDAEVPLPRSATGVLRTTVFDRTLRPVAERLVRRLASERLDVAIQAQHTERNPGESQQLAVRVTDETGAGRRALVGLSVSDEAVLALGSEPRIGLVDHTALFADVEKGEQFGDFFFGAADAPVHVDLLLGTRGWRRFVWRNDAAAQAAIAARGSAADGILAREGFSQTPQVASNFAAASAPGATLAASAERAERRRQDAAMLALVALSLLLVVEAVAWLLRRTLRAPVVVQTFAGVLAAAAVVMALVPRLGESMPPAIAAPAMDFTRDVLTSATFTTAFPVAIDQDAFLGDLGANPLAGAFYRDGGEADVRAARTENFFSFARRLQSPPPDVGLTEPPPLTVIDLNGFAQGSRKGYLTWPIAVQRQYAHQHTPSDDRRDFTPTIYWNTLVATDERGDAAVTFATSDAVTTWRVHADAHVVTGPGRLGQGTTTFATRLPLHVEAKLPDEVSAGDRLLLPVNVASRDASVSTATLAATLGEGLRLGDGAPTTIALQDGRGRALLPITVGDRVGASTLHLVVRAGSWTDRLEHTLQVAPRGFPHRRSLGGTLTVGAPGSATFTIPTAAVPGSGQATLQVFPSPLSTLTAGLDGMLREPHGCFEQTSSTNYPNTLVLNLLEASGDNVPATAARARALLAKGYARLVGFECKRGGFEWFGADPGHEALTAYGLLQFHDMAKVFAVDAAMVQRTRSWLLGRRNDRGDFVHEGHDHHSFGGSQALTNAYCTYALLQSGTPAGELRRELDALVARSTASSDAYELALIANALQLGDRAEAAAVRQRLVAMQKDDGSLRGSTTSITSSGGQDLAVETTGFVVLAWLHDPACAEPVRKALQFVHGCRSGCGTFGATQATVCALRALTAYAQATRTMRIAGRVRVLDGERLLAEREFTAEETQPLRFDLWPLLPPGEHTLRLQLVPAGLIDGPAPTMPWALDVAYHAELPADDPDAALAVTTTLRRTDVVEGGTVALDVTVTNTTARDLPTPIAIVGLPAGCELPTRVLEDLQKGGAFAHWELRGRELVLYWRTLAPNAAPTLTLDLVARVPGTTTGPASRSYLYYTPAQKRWAAPLSLTITPR